MDISARDYTLSQVPAEPEDKSSFGNTVVTLQRLFPEELSFSKWEWALRFLSGHQPTGLNPTFPGRPQGVVSRPVEGAWVCTEKAWEDHGFAASPPPWPLGCPGTSSGEITVCPLSACGEHTRLSLGPGVLGSCLPPGIAWGKKRQVRV